MKTTSTPLHPAEDYDLLRREGLAYIQQLSGKLWTDFNVHDPGVTMLEILAFALADLGFRAGHPIADLLAPETGESPELKQFFTLAEIATTKPWTIDDYRRVLIDMPDVANAWLSRSQGQEVYLYLDEQDREFWTSHTPQPEQTNVLLNGLYEVSVRFEADDDYGDLNDNSVRFWENIPRAQDNANVAVELEIEFPFQSKLPARLRTLTATEVDAFVFGDKGYLPGEQLGWYYTFKLPARTDERYPGEVDIEFVCEVHVLQPQDLPLTTSDLLAVTGSLPWWKMAIQTHFLARRDYIAEKLQAIKSKLLGQRNLCEDFFEIVPMNLQEIALDLEIEVNAGTDLQATEVAIYQAIHEYLDPPLRFYSLAEMLEKGRPTTEIFDGPLLENGFLDREELQPSAQRKAVFGSDILQLVMGVEGVAVVRSLKMNNRIAGDTVAEAEADCIVLTEPGRFQPAVDVRRSRIRFSQAGRPPQSANKADVLNAFRAGRLGRVPYKGLGQPMDLPATYGRPRNLTSYTSVQTEFPEAWGIGTTGLPQNASPARAAQAAQLKGFLYFFEQLLCNYLAQLSHVRRLLAVHGGSPSPTYLSKVAWEIPGIQALLLPILPGTQQIPTTREEFEAQLQALWEDDAAAHERRHRLLDHLLARFNTSMTEAATLSWRNKLVKNAPEYWVAAKERVLRHFPRLGSARASGLDCAQMSTHCMPLSGFQQRLCMLLGWDVPDAFRLHLGSGNEGGTYRLSVVDDAGNVLLTTQALGLSKEPHLAVETMLDLAVQPDLFKIVGNALELKDKQGVKVAWSQPYASTPLAQAAYDQVVAIADKLQLASKMVVVEHILLRPKMPNATSYDLMVPLLSHLQDFDVRDPWSCRLSVVFPHAWQHPELDNEDWRRLMQQTIREELPAHLIVQFLWLNETQYSEFLTDYRRWRAQLYRNVRLGGTAPTTTSNATTLPARMTMLKNLFGAQCVVAPAKMTTQYEDGESIAEVYDPDGRIVKAWVHHYSEAITDYLVPTTGQVHLDRQTGRLFVKQVEGLKPVTKLAFAFATLNQAGGITHHKVELTLHKDDGPLLMVIAPKYDFQFALNEKVAWIDERGVVVVGAEWFAGSAPNSWLQLNPENGDVTVSDPAALLRAVRGASAFSLKIPLKLRIKNHQGFAYTVRKDLDIQQSHEATATPHPDLRLSGPASSFVGEGRYLYEFADPQDGGIAQLRGLGADYVLGDWGLSAVPGGRPQRMQLKITDLPLFLKTFERLSSPVNAFRTMREPKRAAVFQCQAVDGIGNVTKFKLLLQFSAEVETMAPQKLVWSPDRVSGKMADYRSLGVVSSLTVADVGLSSAPTVMDLPPRTALSRTGLGFEPTRDRLPSQALKVGDWDDFLDFVRSNFQMNPAKTSCSYGLRVQKAVERGSPLEATLQLMVEDTPAVLQVKPKYAVTLSIADVSAETVAEVTDADDGGIVTLREPDGGTLLQAWGLKSAVAGTPGVGTISIDNIEVFKAHFQHPAQLNSQSGLFVDSLELIAVDRLGFEKRLRMRLSFSAAPVIATDNPATWQSEMTSQLIAAYGDNKTVGYISDVDGGLLALPTILPPHDVLWSGTSLVFSLTKETKPRLRLRVNEGAAFASFVSQGVGLTKDEFAETADFTFRVALEDLQNHRQELPISLRIKGTGALFTRGPKVADQVLLAQLARTDTLYLVTNPADGGVVGLEPNHGYPSFASWGLKTKPNTENKGVDLVIENLADFKAQFDPENPQHIRHGLLERQFSVIATDYLGFKSVSTLDFRFSLDVLATWFPAFTTTDYASITGPFVFGWIKDPQGIQGVAVTGNPNWGISGLVFELDPAKAPDWALRVKDLNAFQTNFKTVFPWDTLERKRICRLDAKVTDVHGHTTDLPITLRVNEVVTNALPTWTIGAGFDGTKALGAVENTHLVATIADVVDGGIIAGPDPVEKAKLALWGLEVNLDSLHKTALLQVVDAATFKSKMNLSGISEGPNVKATIQVQVTDKQNNKNMVPIPVSLHIDHAPVWDGATGLGLLGNWASGTTIGAFRDALDGGIASYKVLSAPGYTTTGNDLVISLENGEVKVKTGDKDKFEQFVGRNFTLNTTLRTGTYKIKLETVDQFQGKAEIEATINLTYAKINVVYVPGTRKPIGAYRTEDILGTLTYTPKFEWANALLSDGKPPEDWGVEVFSEKPGVLQLRLADGFKFARTALEGKMFLDLQKSYFFCDLGLNLNFSQGESASVSPRIEANSGALSSSDQYGKLVSPQIKMVVSKSSPTVTLPVKTFLPDAVNGSFLLIKGTTTLFKKESTSTLYTQTFTFATSFFPVDPRTAIQEVEFEGTFKYNTKTPMENWKCKFTFLPVE